MDSVECVVVGAGVIGLAVARALARSGREVILLERGDTIGSETSSRNSEVIHAGIYNPTGSWKTRLCVAGRERLYDYCQSRGVGHRRIGKLIVAAAASQVGDLAALQAKAAGNGVTDLQWLEAPQARRLEPAVRCVAALLSPSTGIIDSHGLMLSLQGEAEDAGAAIAFHSPVAGGWIENQFAERRRPTASYFSSANPTGSIMLWHVAQIAFFLCSDSRARPERLPSTVLSLSAGTLGGGGGGGVPRMFSRIHLPRSTGDVRSACDGTARMLP
jgi:hypothetical protein